MEIHERIKQRRKELGLSAEEIASKLNVSPATIYRYENNEIKKFPTDILGPLADVLHTTPAYLLGWDETLETEMQDELFRKRKLLFDKSAKASEEDLNRILAIVDALIANNPED